MFLPAVQRTRSCTTGQVLVTGAAVKTGSGVAGAAERIRLDPSPSIRSRVTSRTRPDAGRYADGQLRSVRRCNRSRRHSIRLGSSESFSGQARSIPIREPKVLTT